MATIKATKISTLDAKNNQLAVFVASLGVTANIELYLCSNFVYINIDVILPVLSVDVAWFKKNAEAPTHYIFIKKKIYINKYGMTKLLGQSKQPAAFMLQDYLYEIFYKVETEGVVVRDSVASRKKLVALSEEVATYKSMIEQTQDAVEAAREETKTLINDCATLELENTKLLDQLDQAEFNIETLTKELDIYKNIANKLAKYVRVKSKQPPDEAFSDILEEEDLDTSDTSTMAIIEKNAIAARMALKKAAVPKVYEKQVRKVVTVHKDTYYILRSAAPVDNEFNYQWSITDVEPSDDIIHASEDYKSGTVTSIAYPNIYYRKICTSEDKKNTILLFLELMNDITDEQIIERLLA